MRHHLPELLACLHTLGIIMGISPSILGITVLAWGNSVGDLVADVVIARSGQPTMAMAACFSGPMFNMLIGLGLAWSVKCAKLYPQGARGGPSCCDALVKVRCCALVCGWRSPGGINDYNTVLRLA